MSLYDEKTGGVRLISRLFTNNRGRRNCDTATICWFFFWI
jgi:hypothetical protein